MSDDLISRKALIENLEKWCGKQSYLIPNEVWDIIKNAPTAYDVDAVCKNLDKSSDYYETDEQGREHVQMVSLTDAIEIVRNGGKKE